MNKRKGQEGFTLVELLVVVVIIGILASVAIPNFVGAQDKAKNSAVQANCHTVQMGVEQYGVDNGGAYGALSTTIMVANASYIAGDNYPKTPWNTQQTAEIAGSSAPIADGASYAAGTAVAPTSTSNYGAIAFLASGTANDRYDIQGVGKKGGNAVKVNGVRNW